PIAGDELTLAPSVLPSPSRVIYAAEEATRAPAMAALQRAGVADTLDEYGLNIGGHIEVGWSYNFDNPSSHLNPGRVFDLEDQDPTLHQIDVFVERNIAANGEKFDIGGKMEWLWGGDARFIHANGLFDHYGFTDGPEEQFDLVQLYGTFNVPVGNGLLLTAGKFVTLLGYETINPTTNPLYSHTYLFGFGIPFTHTGVLARYQFSENWWGTAGIVRGWDQALEDANDAVSFIGQAGYSKDNIDFYLNVITGPEQANNESNYRTVFNPILVYRDSDQLTFAIDAIYGWEPESAADGGDGQWWGAAGYVSYKIDSRFTAQGRAEYFSDQDGSRGLGTQLTEVTVGLNIRPLPDDQWGRGLVIRPEIRFDYAEDPGFNGEDTQWTFGIDAIYAF
ncbi:MAG TPA: outer membrane beta-barrel protein, partial [Tepidisphaeraceae bacterium]|nr:outer membrane beta-barrel protein [Tepidisphaeraceae bacterium]